MERCFRDQTGEVKYLGQIKEQWKQEGIAKKKDGLNRHLKECIQTGALVEIKRKRFYGKQVYTEEWI